MGPIPGRVGSLGGGVTEEIAGDKKTTPAVLTAIFFKKTVFAIFGMPNGSVAASVNLEREFRPQYPMAMSQKTGG